jgi:hypothetical protein
MKTNLLVTFTASAFLVIGSPVLAGSVDYFEVNNFALALFEGQGIIISAGLLIALLALLMFATSSDDFWRTWKPAASKIIVASGIQFFSLSLMCFLLEKTSMTLVGLAIWNLFFVLILSFVQANAPSLGAEKD